MNGDLAGGVSCGTRLMHCNGYFIVVVIIITIVVVVVVVVVFIPLGTLGSSDLKHVK